MVFFHDRFARCRQRAWQVYFAVGSCWINEKSHVDQPRFGQYPWAFWSIWIVKESFEENASEKIGVENRVMADMVLFVCVGSWVQKIPKLLHKLWPLIDTPMQSLPPMHTHTQACPCAHALANTKLSRREIWWDALQDACWLCRYRCRLVWLQQWPASWSKALKFHILWLVNQCQSINIHRCQIRFCQIGHCSQAGLCERTTQVWNCATELLPCNKLPVLILFDRHSRRIDSKNGEPMGTNSEPSCGQLCSGEGFLLRCQKFVSRRNLRRLGQVSVWQPALLAVGSLSDCRKRWFAPGSVIMYQVAGAKRYGLFSACLRNWKKHLIMRLTSIA